MNVEALEKGAAVLETYDPLSQGESIQVKGQAPVQVTRGRWKRPSAEDQE